MMGPWVLPVLVGSGAVLWLLSRSRPDYSDMEWIARVLVMEAGDIGPSEEWAGIANVALNRVARPDYPDSLRGVVATTSWPGGGDRGREFVRTIQQQGGEGYRDSRGRPAPPDHRRWSDALQFAELVVNGDIDNPVGNRAHFFHPGGMPRCENDGEWDGNKLCVNGRLWPRWGVEGYSEFPPIRVGRAIFS